MGAALKEHAADGGSIAARTLDYFGWLVAASLGALVSALVSAICIKYEERGLASVWAAAFFGFVDSEEFIGGVTIVEMRQAREEHV
jgi:hypothetical protein